MVDPQAAVLHDADAGGAQAVAEGRVADAALRPHRPRPRGDKVTAESLARRD